jgi:hypothetical protein
MQRNFELKKANMQIYKSCTAGMSDEQFKQKARNGLTTFISYERMLRQSIGSELKPKERIVGMVIGYDGIELHLEIIK